MASIKIETGIKTYDIVNENDELLCQIKINASDINLLSKIYKLQETIQMYLNKFEDADIDKMYDTMIECETGIKKAIDDVLGEGTSENVFKSQSIFSEYEGTSFLERFVSSILDTLANDIKENENKKLEKAKAYTERVIDEW